MWGSEKQKKADIGRFSGKTTIIAQDAEVIGDLRFVGAVQVDGRVVGNIEGRTAWCVSASTATSRAASRRPTW